MPIGDTNYYFNYLVRAGERIIKDEIFNNTHRFYFSCGCQRDYKADPILLTDSEIVAPCKKHYGKFKQFAEEMNK